MTLSITMLSYYAECHILFTIMLNVIVLRVIMLSVIMLNVIMLNVVMLNVVMLSVVMVSVVTPFYLPSTKSFNAQDLNNFESISDKK
jgi:hypothetical protein